MGERPTPREVGENKAERKASELLKHRFRHGVAAEAFNSDFADKLFKQEQRKSEIDERSIEIANQVTNEALAELGLDQFDVPSKNIYFFDPGVVDDAELQRHMRSYFDHHSVAVTISSHQSILLDLEEIQNPLARASVLLHEIIHLKAAYTTRMHFQQGLDLAQMGLQRQVRINKKRRFVGEGLNEAIVAEIERRLLPKLLEAHEGLWGTAEQVYDSYEALARRESIAKRFHVPYDEVVYAGDNGDFALLGYPDQRNVLWYVVNKIADTKKVSSEEIWPLFLQTQFTGDVEKLEKFVDESFSVGAYRVLEKMAVEPSSARRTLDLLIKMYKAKHEHQD